jgi:hypothetical protein
MGTITISEFGTVGSDPLLGYDGIDHAGIFGPPGASLVGKSFTAIFTGSDCNCDGGLGTPRPNPVQDATLTINGQTFDFGSGVAGDMFTSVAQVDLFDSSGRSFLNIHTDGLGMGAGQFIISGGDAASGTFHGQFNNSLLCPGRSPATCQRCFC